MTKRRLGEASPRQEYRLPKSPHNPQPNAGHPQSLMEPGVLPTSWRINGQSHRWPGESRHPAINKTRISSTAASYHSSRYPNNIIFPTPPTYLRGVAL